MKRRRTDQVNLKGDQTGILEVLDQDSQVLSQGSSIDLPYPGLMLVTSNELKQCGIDDGEQLSNNAMTRQQEAGKESHHPDISSSDSEIQEEEFVEDSEIQPEVMLDASDTDNVEFLNDLIQPPAKVPKRDFRGRGKPMDPVWNEFKSDPKIKQSKVKCRHCSSAISNKVQRLKTHLSKCVAFKNSASRRKSVPEQLSSNASPQILAMKVPQGDLTTAAPFSIMPGMTRQGKMTSFLDRMTKPEQDDLRMEVGRYVYSMNLPFTHVEHPAFIRIFQKLRPSFSILCRKTIGGSVLNITYQTVVKEQASQIKDQYVIVLQDGWKTRTSEPVVAHSLIAGGKPYFLNAVGTEENKKTSEYCAGLLRDAITEVIKMGGKVLAVVTDNCSSMKKMRKLIQKDFPGLYTYGCHAQLLNLVGKMCTPADTMKKVQTVHTFFRNHEAVWAKLKRKKAGRPILASAVRWNSWLDTFEYYVKTQTKFLEVSRDSSTIIDDEVLEIISDNRFFAEVRQTIAYMKPIQVALDTVQREKSTLADGINEWVKLRDSLTFENSEIQEYFIKQFNRAVQAVGIAAHMLHPKYRGEGLDADLIAAGNAFLSEANPFLIVIAAQLKQKNESYFPVQMFEDRVIDKCSPVDWWSSQKSFGKLTADIVEFAMKLNQLSAGSAEIERHFSTLGNIINVRRTRLGIDKASKLCVIYKHFATEEPPFDDGGDWDIPEDE